MSFPQELTALRQWICWRLEPDPRGEKPRKVPYDPRTGRKASSTNPETWATLPEAMRAQTKYLFTGVGFVFTEAGGIVGVDIDYADGASRAASEDPSSGGEQRSYVLNINTRKFHDPSCSGVADIKEENRQDYSGSRELLIQQGYSPCGRCRP